MILYIIISKICPSVFLRKDSEHLGYFKKFLRITLNFSSFHFEMGATLK